MKLKVNRRQALTIAIGAMVGFLIVYAVLNGTLLAPAARLDRQADDLRGKIRKLEAEVSKADRHESRLAALAGRTLGPGETQVSERMRARLMGLLAPSGLDAQQTSSSPLASRRLSRKANDKEVSRSVSIKGGKLSHAINLLYLLSVGSELHRLDTLSLKPSGAGPGRVDLNFKYSTLALEPTGSSGSASRPATRPAGRLDTPQRQQYELLIASRDILRPYVRRERPQPQPERPRPSPPPPPPPPPPSAPPEASWRLAGLPTLFGKELIHVRHVSSGEVKTYKIGQRLAGGQIVMIDCRPVRRKDNPREFSDSRVILKISSAYWAVEIGDSLAQKRQLATADLPEHLRPAPATAPAVRGDSARR